MAVVGVDVVVAVVTRALAVLAASALLMAGGPAPALAQFRVQACGERGSVVRALGEKYGERLAAQGVTAGGLLLELLVAPRRAPGDPQPPEYTEGSWTIIVTRPDGNSCIGASGEGWTPAVGAGGDVNG